MDKIVIGIVEDDVTQINSICRTLYSHFQKNDDLTSRFELDFKPYDISKNLDSILSEITEDIEKTSIDFIIVDYKIVSSNSNTNGVEIVTKLKKIVREFPTIILTEREAECSRMMDIDPDKIYSKKGFLKAKDDYSIEASSKIFKNIFRYSNKKESLMHRISELKKANEDSGDLDNINELLMLEKELSDYYPDGETSVEKALDRASLNEIVRLIEQANALLEE